MARGRFAGRIPGTERRLARIADDLYETPRWQTLALLSRIPVRGDVMEPTSGEQRAIATVLTETGFSVATNDLVPTRPADTHLDARQPASWHQWPQRDWVIGNPPFKYADQIVPLALAWALRGVAMLLRLTWLEPTKKRAALLERLPPSRVIVLPRHSYRGNRKTDSVTSAWMVWGAGVKPGIEVVTKAERDALMAGAPTRRLLKRSA